MEFNFKEKEGIINAQNRKNAKAGMDRTLRSY